MLMAADDKQTHFAPAQRDSKESVTAESKRVLAMSMMRHLLDAVPDPLLILNDKRQIVFANRKILELTDANDMRALYGSRPGEALRCVHADETPAGCGTAEACRHCGSALAILEAQEGRGAQRECRILKRKGEALTLRVSTTPFELDGRRYVIHHATDISDVKRRHALESALYTGLLTGAQELRGDAEGLREAMDPAQFNALRDETLRFSAEVIGEVNEHRLLAAAEQGKLNSRPVAVSNRELLAEVVAYYSHRAAVEDKVLRIEKHCKEVLFSTDPVLLKQTLGYLITNALEAVEERETVTLATGPQGSGVDFRVHNVGTMPRAVQLQVFQQGFSTRGEGRGVGTYAARLLTEKHLGGEVSFASTERVGTVFRVTLPAHP
jgi:K+-sensing histidine kinase KdpD